MSKDSRGAQRVTTRVHPLTTEANATVTE